MGFFAFGSLPFSSVFNWGFEKNAIFKILI